MLNEQQSISVGTLEDQFMKLYVIRHGESLGNIRQARTPNCGLSPLGAKQAELVADFFMDIPIKVIYSSPLSRAIQTALPLAKSINQPIVLAPDMAEIFKHTWTEDERNYAWESCRQIETAYPEARFIEGFDRNSQWWPVWPELQNDVERRVGRFLKSVLSCYYGTDANVVVFGHGASTSRLRMQVCPEAVSPKLESTNAVIFEYELNKAGNCLNYQVHSKFLEDHLSGTNLRDY